MKIPTEKKFSLILSFTSGFRSKVETFAFNEEKAIEQTQERYSKYPEAFSKKKEGSIIISKVKESKRN